MNDTPPMMPACKLDVTGVSGIACSVWLARPVFGVDITAYVGEDTRMTKTNHHTRGRGSNPASRQNLTGAVRDAYVYERGAGIGWTELAGPMAYNEAASWAAKLEKHNATGQPIYAATRGRI